MRVIDYIAIVVTIVFIVGLVGCFVRWGCPWFWFYAGVTVLSGAVLCQLSEQ